MWWGFTEIAAARGSSLRLVVLNDSVPSLRMKLDLDPVVRLEVAVFPIVLRENSEAGDRPPALVPVSQLLGKTACESGWGDSSRRSRVAVFLWRQAALDFTVPPVRHTFEMLECTNRRGEADHLVVIEVEASERRAEVASRSTRACAGDARGPHRSEGALAGASAAPAGIALSGISVSKARAYRSGRASLPRPEG